jgi:hypothetical protein
LPGLAPTRRHALRHLEVLGDEEAQLCRLFRPRLHIAMFELLLLLLLTMILLSLLPLSSLLLLLPMIMTQLLR